MISNSTLHYSIIKHIVDFGFAPSIVDLSMKLNAPQEEVVKGLQALQDYHGVVLHPKSSEVWVIHPFSLAPTNFYVQSQNGAWWGNCAWCSLGIAALLEEDVLITTTLGGEVEQIELNITNGSIVQKDYFIHFPIAMQDAWDNVIYTCSNMLIFKSEEEVDKWTAKHNIAKGDIQPIGKIWEFSKRWYGHHLDPDWIKWTVAEAKDLFQEFGLNHRIWDLPSSERRF